MNGKIVLVSELFYPNKTSTAYIMTEIANKFANSGKSVEVITSDIKYDSNVISEDYHFDFSITRIKTIKGDKNNFLFRLFSSVYNSILLIINILKKISKGDFLFAVTNPFFIILFLALIRKFKSFKYILLVHDIFPENSVPAGILKKDSILYKILLRIFNWAYQQADQNIVLGSDMKKILESKGVLSSKIEVIQNWFDSDIKILKNIDRNEYFGHPLDDKLVIGFAGNIGRVQHLEGFLEIFVKCSNSKLVCCIIGEGASLSELKLKYDRENILFLGAKPRNEQNVFLNSFDLGLITLGKGMFGLGVPSKSYNLIALKKPILYIGDRFSEIDELVNKNIIGKSFTWDDELDILNWLNSLSIDNIKNIVFDNNLENDYNQEVILNKIFNTTFVKGTE